MAMHLRRALSSLVVVVTVGSVLAGCDMRVAGTRCKPNGAAAHDANYVLVCTKGHWRRTITTADAAKILVALVKNATPVRVTAGYGHTCSIMVDASMKCWGGNVGQLGNGTTTPSTRPASV